VSRIQSPVEEVEKLLFYPLPSRKKIDVSAVVRVNRTHVFLSTSGKLYSTQVRDKCYYTLTGGLEDTLDGCRILGLLSKEAVAKHNAEVSLMLSKRERKWSADSIVTNMKTLGLRMTKAQLRAIETARNEFKE